MSWDDKYKSRVTGFTGTSNSNVFRSKSPSSTGAWDSYVAKKEGIGSQFNTISLYDPSVAAKKSYTATDFAPLKTKWTYQWDDQYDNNDMADKERRERNLPPASIIATYDFTDAKDKKRFKDGLPSLQYETKLKGLQADKDSNAYLQERARTSAAGLPAPVMPDSIAALKYYKDQKDEYDLSLKNMDPIKLAYLKTVNKVPTEPKSPGYALTKEFPWADLALDDDRAVVKDVKLYQAQKQANFDTAMKQRNLSWWDRTFNNAPKDVVTPTMPDSLLRLEANKIEWEDYNNTIKTMDKGERLNREAAGTMPKVPNKLGYDLPVGLSWDDLNKDLWNNGKPAQANTPVSTGTPMPTPTVTRNGIRVPSAHDVPITYPGMKPTISNGTNSGGGVIEDPNAKSKFNPDTLLFNKTGLDALYKAGTSLLPKPEGDSSIPMTRANKSVLGKNIEIANSTLDKSISEINIKGKSLTDIQAQINTAKLKGDNDKANTLMTKYTAMQKEMAPQIQQYEKDVVSQKALSDNYKNAKITDPAGWEEVVGKGLMEGIHGFNIQTINAARIGYKILNAPSDAIIRGVYGDKEADKQAAQMPVANWLTDVLKSQEAQSKVYSDSLKDTTGLKKIAEQTFANVPQLIAAAITGAGLESLAAGTVIAGVVPGAADATGIIQAANKAQTVAAAVKAANFQKAIRMVPFGAGAGASYARDAELDGKPFAQQVIYGVVGGLLEVATESPVLEGFLSLPGAVVEAKLKSGAMTFAKRYGAVGVQWLSNGMKEFAQEAVMEPLGALAKKATLDKTIPYVGDKGVLSVQRLKDSVQSGFGGIGMYIIMSSLGLPGMTASKIQINKAVRENQKLDKAFMDSFIPQYMEDMQKNPEQTNIPVKNTTVLDETIKRIAAPGTKTTLKGLGDVEVVSDIDDKHISIKKADGKVITVLKTAFAAGMQTPSIAMPSTNTVDVPNTTMPSQVPTNPVEQSMPTGIQTPAESITNQPITADSNMQTPATENKPVTSQIPVQNGAKKVVDMTYDEKTIEMDRLDTLIQVKKDQSKAIADTHSLTLAGTAYTPQETSQVNNYIKDIKTMEAQKQTIVDTIPFENRQPSNQTQQLQASPIVETAQPTTENKNVIDTPKSGIIESKISDTPVFQTLTSTEKTSIKEWEDMGFDTAGLLTENDKITSILEKDYENMITDHIEYLKSSGHQGVTQGSLNRRDEYGEVVGRVGRVSNNPQWYRDYYAEHKKGPTSKADYRELAIKQLKEGFDAETMQVTPDEDFVRMEGDLNGSRELKRKLIAVQEATAVSGNKTNIGEVKTAGSESNGTEQTESEQLSSRTDRYAKQADGAGGADLSSRTDRAKRIADNTGEGGKSVQNNADGRARQNEKQPNGAGETGRTDVSVEEVRLPSGEKGHGINKGSSTVEMAAKTTFEKSIKTTGAVNSQLTPADKLSESQLSILSKLKKAVGVDVFFYDSDSTFGDNGFMSEGLVFVKNGTKIDTSWVYGHEALHAIQEIAPNIMEQLNDDIGDISLKQIRQYVGLLKGDEAYRAKMFADAERIKGEMIADMFGNIMSNSNYETYLTEKQQQTVVHAYDKIITEFKEKIDPQDNKIDQATDSDKGVLFTARDVVPAFYPKLTKTIEDKMPKQAYAPAILGLIRSAQIKAEEVKWSGIEDWLRDQNGKVTKDSVTEFLRMNEIQIEEVTHTEDTKFRSYTLPGGDNYRELLFTLPDKKIEERRALSKKDEERPLTPKEEARFKELNTETKNKPFYKSPHWDEINVLAHTRLNDRTDINGNKVIFIEEIQSDWHQKGRQDGYKTADLVRRTEIERANLIAERDTIIRKYNEYDNLIAARSKMTQEEREREHIISNKLASLVDISYMPSDAPFQKTWHEFVLKRLIRYAAENGYDKLAWTTGEQQADRYDLSKQVDSIIWKSNDPSLKEKGKTYVTIRAQGKIIIDKNMTPSEMEDTIGKELTSKIVNSKKDAGILEGVDLKVGGEGMSGFYDRMIPEFLNKYAKKWGTKVEETKLGKDNWDYEIIAKDGHLIATWEFDSIEEAQQEIKSRESAYPVFRGAHAQRNKQHIRTTIAPSLPITDAMKESVLYEGQPLFTAREMNKKAIKEFGVTKDIKEAGYLLIDGTMLDFSGKRQGGSSGVRHIDHREIDTIFEEDLEWGDAMAEFVDMGNIRLYPEGQGFYLSKIPTLKQKDGLRAFINKFRGEIYVDLVQPGGHNRKPDYAEYGERTASSRILNDIDTYFKDGTVPKGTGQPLFTARELIKTKEFKKWFGDSKVTDSKNNPLEVYHGTAYGVFNKFAKNKIGANYESVTKGFYFTSDISEAEDISEFPETIPKKGTKPNVISAYLSLQSPIIKDAPGKSDATTYFDSNMDDLLSQAEYGDNDGIIINGTGKNEGKNLYVAFKPNQIKSSVNNTGKFSPINDDIRYTARELTATPEFKRWFRDSKVADKDGVPLIVHHGTDQEFSEFKGLAWFTNNINKAQEYSKVITPNTKTRKPHVKEVYLSIQKPKYINFWIVQSDAEKYMNTEKYDGVIVKNVGGSDNTFYIVKNSNQIKSAINNNGEFSPEMPDINKSARDMTQKGTFVLSRPDTTAPTTLNSLMKNVGKPNANPVTRSEIERFVSERLDIPVAQGKFRQHALGIFKPNGVIRLKKTKDLVTLFHEVGHALDQWLNLHNGDEGFKNELMDLGAATSRATYSDEKIMQEGVAQFTMFYVTDNAQAKERAPEFYKFFESKIEDESNIKSLLKASLEAVKDYNGQTPQQRILGNVSLKEQKPPFKERLDLHKLYITMFDELHPLYLAVQKITGGEGITAAMNPFMRAWAFRGVAGKADAILKYGPLDNNGKHMGRSFQDIIQPVAHEMDDFRTYILVKHGQELEEKGKTTGFEKGDIESELARLDGTKYEPILKELAQFQHNVLHQLVDSGIMSEESFKTITESYNYYIPFQRVMDSKKGGGVSKGYQANNPVHGIKGSIRDIIDPLQSIIANTFIVTNMADRNRIGSSLVELADQYDWSGRILDKVPPRMMGQKFSISEIEKVLKDAGVDTANINMDTLATTFRPTGYGPKDKVITVFKEGKPTYYEVFDEDLYTMFAGLDKESTNVAIKILSIPAKILRAGATGLNPDFIGRNVLKDTIFAGLNSKYNFIPFVDSLKGLAHVLNQDDMYQKWLYSGGANAEMISVDRDAMKNSLQKLLAMSAKDKTMKIIQNPIELIRAWSAFSEDATRVGIFAKGFEKEGKLEAGKRQEGESREEFIKRRKDVSESGLMEAGVASREGTVDFGRFGTITKNINKAVAFFNVALQGGDTIVRSYRRNPTKFLIRSMMYLTIPSIAFFLLNHDDPEYQEMPQYKKDLFWMFKAGDVWYAIPKPFEPGMLFGTLPERFLKYVLENDPKALDGWKEQFISVISPNILPTAIVPALEAQFNYDSFRKLPIVPASERYTKPANQFGPYTSTFAKSIGKLLNVSPRQVDHLISGYAAGVGISLAQIAGAGLEATGLASKTVQADAPWETQIPVIRGLTTEPYRNSKSVNDFYNELNAMETEYQQAKDEKNIELGQFPKASALRKLRKTSDKLAETRREYNDTYSNNKISSDVKKQQLSKLNMLMINFSRQALGKPMIKE